MQQRLCDIEGFVLAGGASRRMGADKCRLDIEGATLLERAAAALQTTTARTRVVGRMQSALAWLWGEEESKIQLSFVADVYRSPDGRAPHSALTGLHAALWHARTEWVAVIACDLPFVTSDLVQRLAAMRTSSERIEAVIPVQPDGRLQPLCALYRRTPCLRRATEALDEGDYSLHSFLGRLSTRKVPAHELADLPDARRFFVNVNTPEDYAKANDERMSAE